jgi:hypothetical protein
MQRQIPPLTRSWEPGRTTKVHQTHAKQAEVDLKMEWVDNSAKIDKVFVSMAPALPRGYKIRQKLLIFVLDR